MTDDELNAIEARAVLTHVQRADDGAPSSPEDIAALVAEVRRLREENAKTCSEANRLIAASRAESESKHEEAVALLETRDEHLANAREAIETCLTALGQVDTKDASRLFIELRRHAMDKGWRILRGES